MSLETVGGLIEPGQHASVGCSGGDSFHACFTEGNRMVDTWMDIMRRELEQCDVVKDMLFYSSMAGATSSGLIRELVQGFEIHNGSKFCTVKFSVVPSPDELGQEVLTPFNNILGIKETCDAFSSLLDIWVDNKALYRLCEQYLGIQAPSFSDINRLIA